MYIRIGNKSSHIQQTTRCVAPADLMAPTDAAPSNLVYAFAHVYKTGGTALSDVLAYTTTPICGSRRSKGFCATCIACGPTYMTMHCNPITIWPNRDRLDSCRAQYGTDSAMALSSADNASCYDSPVDLEQAAQLEKLPTYTRSSVRTLYAHAGVGFFARVFPPARLRYLVLVRHVVPHRISWWRDKKGTSNVHRQMGGNFSTWIASKQYKEMECSVQVRNYAPLMSDSRKRSNDGCDHLKHLCGRYDGRALASRLLANPNVAWVGVSDLWYESMRSLSLELGLGERFLPIALAAKARMAHNEQWLPITQHDFKYLSALDSTEDLFVATLQRHVIEMSAGVATRSSRFNEVAYNNRF